MNNSRTKNLSLNVLVGYISQILILILQFVGRRIFVIFLSREYLGINGLYTNILTVLSLAELGLNTVVQFYFYKPVANDDRPMIRSLLAYFRKIYTLIAACVFTLGIALIPVLRFIINSDLAQGDLILYYVLFLTNTVLSYFAAQKVALLAANQDNRVQKLIHMVSAILVQILHIAVLAIFKNFTAYVVVTLLGTLFQVVMINHICNKRYPYIKEKSDLVPIEKKSIAKDVGSTFLYKIGGVLINNTDNILISTIVSTAAVGLYSNYFMVVSAIQGFISIITVSLISAIGNLAAEKNRGKMHSTFRVMLLFYHFIACFGGISFALLFNDLIPIWLGSDYLLSMPTVIVIALNFYLTSAISPVWMCREANGLFGKVKLLLLTTAFLNLVLSIVFGICFGVFGILAATIVARILTQVWYEPRLIYREVFQEKQFSYWLGQAKYLLLTIVCGAICYFVSTLLTHSFIFMFLKAMIFFVVCAVVFFVTNRKSNEMQILLRAGARVFGKLRKKRT